MLVPLDARFLLPQGDDRDAVLALGEPLKVIATFQSWLRL